MSDNSDMRATEDDAPDFAGTLGTLVASGDRLYTTLKTVSGPLLQLGAATGPRW